MAKKAAKKPTAAKTRAKKPTVKKAPKPKASKKAAAPKTAAKYDQSGAPWWKKFWPTQATESKR
jgi:hypothetical protein